MKIIPVNETFLVEAILRTDAQHEETKKKVEKAGLIMVAKTQPNNRETFEGIPNQGYVRYLPESYKGEIKAGTRIVFQIEKPNGFHIGDEKLISVKQAEIVAIIPEAE